MIYVVTGEDTQHYPELMQQVHRLRHDVFVDELGWSDLANDDRLETDQFDRPDAIHHISVRDDKVVGYQRMLPTVKPHLLSDVFPELCEGTPPRALDLYELTRYCVAPAYREGRRGVGSVGSELLTGFVEWGLDCNINRIIIEFETIWVLRAIQLKFMVRPLGFETRIGKQKIVATQLGFNQTTLLALREYQGHSDPVVSYLGELETEQKALAS